MNTLNLQVDMDDKIIAELVKMIQSLQVTSKHTEPVFKEKTIKEKAVKVEKAKLKRSCMDMQKTFVEFVKDIKPSTAKGYWSKLRTIYNRYTGKVWDGCDFDWLNNTDEVLKFISNHEAWGKTSKWSYINAITSIISRIEGYDDAYKVYSEANRAGLETYVKTREENILNKQQLENIVSWPTVLEQTAPADLKGELLFELLRWIPRRSGTYRQLRWRSADGKGNYFLVTDGKVDKMVLNVYKTAKTYGKFEIAVEEFMSDLVMKYIRLMGILDGGFLLSTSQNQSQFASWSTDTMARIFKGKRMGTTLCRISYASHHVKKHKSVKEQKAVARKLGHSLEQLRLYAKIDL